MLTPGRHVYCLNSFEGITHVVDFDIVKFRRFLPAGSVAVGEPASIDGIRRHSLVQLYTDPGGLRTLIAADLRLKKPQGVLDR